MPRGIPNSSAENPTGEVEMADPNAALAEALLKAMERLQPAQGISKDDLKEVMESNSEGMRRALKPENARHPDISAFNPLGERDHPRPALRRKCFMSPGYELRAEELTREEIDLLNSIEHNMEARSGAWRADLKRTATDGTAELHIAVPTNPDDRADLPKGLSLILRELVGGTQAVDPASLAQRVAELEKALAAKA